MSKQKISYDLDLVIGGNLTEIEQKLHGLKNGLSSILDSKDAPKGLTRQFEQISALMDKIKDKTSSPITSASGFKSLGKDIEKLELSFNGLVREINKIDDLPDEVKIQIFPPEEQKRLQTAIESLKTYEQSLDNINKKKKELETAQRAQTRAGKEKTSADRNVSYTKERIATKTGKKKELEAKLIGISDKDSERAASYRAQIANLEQELTDLNSRLKEQEQIQASANSAYEQATTKVSQLQGGLDGLQGSSLKELRDKAKELGISFRKTKDETPEQAMARLAEKIKAVLAGGLEKIPEELNDLTAEARETQTEVRKMGDAVGEAGDEFDNMSKTASAGDAFAGRIKQMLGIQGAARLMRAALQDAIQTITDLDKTMTEMAVVTDLGVGDYWSQLPEYSKRATELGVSINSAYEAATLFYQQGLKTNEVVEISTETLKMARVAGLGAEEATNKMTAALRGFNMELNETSAQKVSDVYSELAAITASDVNEISTAMTKTASIASSAGMEFETTAAFLSQIIETTRESAETAGTAMKTVIARFQELKKSPDEIGEVDGEIVDANQIEGALRTVGVALRDAGGQFRDLDDVFLELASKWDSLDKNTQRYIATIAAGSRQQSRFIAMMSDYGRTQDLVSAANNSAGASNKQFEKTLESMEAKMEQLKNAWHEFTMGIINSDLVKAGVDLATKFLNIINSLTSGLDGLGSSWTKIIGFIAMFKLGIKVFDLIKPKLIDALASVAQEFKAAGKKAGEQYQEGVEESTKKQAESSTDTPQLDSTNNGQGGGKKKVGRKKKKAQKKKQQKAQVPPSNKKQTEENVKNINKQDKAEETFTTKAEARAKKWGSAMNNAGMALMGVGVAMNMVSQGLRNAGLDGAADSFEKISQWVMIAGSALMTVGMLLNIVTPLIKKAGDAGKDAGVKTGLGGIIAAIGWGPFLLIILAIVAVVASLIIMFAILAKNSPAAKLKEATKMADDATTAANNAKEAYDKLGESLDNLGEKYKNLEELRKGTEEWSKAVQDVNNSVLDLIQEYPELASLVKNEGGVLTLDVDSDEVRAVMNKYEATAVAAEGAKLGAKIRVSEAESTLDFSKLEAIDKVADLRGYKATGGEGYSTMAAAATKTDSELQNATEELALAVNEGQINPNDITAMEDFLKQMKVSGDEAKLMAEEFAKNSDALVDFGQSTTAARAEQEAYYQAMATNAQQLIDLGAYSEKQIDQMTTVVDNEIMDKFKQDKTAEFEAMNKEDFNKAKEDFVKETYGEDYRVDGNKVIDKAGEVVREFADTEAWITEMAAAEATLQAAQAMEAIPQMIAEAIQFLKDTDFSGQGDETARVLKKALTDAGSLNQNELDVYNKLVNDEAAVKNLWNSLSDSSKKAFGWTGTDATKDAEAEKAFFDTLKESSTIATDGFEKANANAVKLGITLDRSFGAEAMQGWTNNLLEFAPAATQSQLSLLNTELTELLTGYSSEQKDAFMAHLNSMDMMDKNAWENLGYAAKQLDIDLDPTALKEFAAAGINASHAIEKIDFTNFAEKISNTYKLLDKIEKGGRTYEENDYKELISANEQLKDEFVKIGDEFHYIGGSMDKLREAIEENTTKNLLEANQQLGIKTEMVRAMKTVKEELGDPEEMSEDFLRYYIGEMREAASLYGNVDALGVAGLANNTDISAITDISELRRIATELAGFNLITYEQDYAKGMRAANIEAYTHNASLFNAEKAADLDSEFADEHQEALLLQAVKSGGVSNALIEKYQEAIKGGDPDEILKVGKEISASVDEIVEENENRDAYLSLIEQVEEAIIDLRQKEIDKLEDVNESINNANDKLVAKIQEQIDADRQARENEQAEQEIADMRSRLAYLGADTSDVNALSMLDVQKEIKDAEQELKDARIDQAIANLEDANDKAAEQREEQINLLQQQLDTDEQLGIITEQATQIVQESLEKINDGMTAATTDMGKIIALGAGWDTMTDEDRANAISDLRKTSTAAANYFDQRGKRSANVSGDQNSKPTANPGGVVNNDQNKPSSSAQQSHGNSTYVPYKATINGDTLAEQHWWYGNVIWANVTAGNATGTLCFSGLEDTKIGANAQAAGIRDKEIFAYDGWHYLLEDGIAHALKPNVADWHSTIEPNMVPYKTGGLADFTGPAWLDGTKSKPELVLNQKDTANFIVLKDVLSEILDGTGSLSQKEGQNGDNYFNIDINVEKLEDDYDVEQLADKIRRMIYDDATYRNVNTINLIR